MTSQAWGDVVAQPASQIRSLLADRGGFFSSNPGLVAGETLETSVQLLAIVLLEVCDRNCSRWVLQEQGVHEPGTGRWRLPGTFFAPGELPLLAAARGVTEQISMWAAGQQVSWAGLENRVLGVAMDWLPELRLASEDTCGVAWENTLVFTYHARMAVPDVDAIELRDVSTGLGRRTWLAGIIDLQTGIADGLLCPASEQLWKSYWQGQPL